jgi:hypothetical protein
VFFICMINDEKEIEGPYQKKGVQDRTLKKGMG